MQKTKKVKAIKKTEEESREYPKWNFPPAFPPQPYGPLSGGGAPLALPAFPTPKKQPDFKLTVGEMDSKGLKWLECILTSCIGR